MGDSVKTVIPLMSLAAFAVPGLQALTGAHTGAAATGTGAGLAGSSAGYSAGAGTSSLLSQAGSRIAANPGTALSALSTAFGGIAGIEAARAQENALKIRQAEAALRLSEAERDTQERLTRTLSRQNNFFAAIGADPGSGAALRARQGAIAQAGRELSVIGTRRQLSGQSYAIRRRRARHAGGVGAGTALLQLGGRVL